MTTSNDYVTPNALGFTFVSVFGMSKREAARRLRAGAKILDSQSLLARGEYLSSEGNFCSIGACRNAQTGNIFNGFPCIESITDFNDNVATSPKDAARNLRRIARDIEHGGSIPLCAPQETTK